jgi:hypothetical protein
MVIITIADSNYKCKLKSFILVLWIRFQFARSNFSFAHYFFITGTKGPRTMIMQHKLISIALLAFICASQCEKVSSTVRSYLS